MPDLFPFPLEWLQAFLLVFVRVTAALAFVPVLGGQAVPSHVKVGLSAMTAVIMFPLVGRQYVSVDMDVWTMGLLVAGEAMIGLATAALVNMVFAAVQLAAGIVGFQIGFGIVNVVDPISNAQVSITGQFLNITAMLLFMSLNAHHMLISGLAESFALIPLGGFDMSAGLGEIFIRSMGAVYLTAAQIAAPILVALLLKQAAMGLIARTVPQINIFIVGFPLTIALGLLTIGICLPAFSLFMNRAFDRLFDDIGMAYSLM